MPPKSNKKSQSSTSKKNVKTSQLNSKRAREPSEEPTYIVEDILDRKRVNGVYKYKVKWQGYSEDECTWEPIKHLEAVKHMVLEFNQRFKNKENEDKEEEKSMKSKIKKESAIKTRSVQGKASQDKNHEENEEKKASSNKASPYKKVKMEETQAESESVKKTNYGHFKLGDKPKKIVHAKKDKDELIFTIEWEPHESGKVPLNTEMTALELRKFDKDLLLDFYEERLKFVKATPKDSMQKSVSKTRQLSPRPSDKGSTLKMEEEKGDKLEYEVVNSDPGENDRIRSKTKKEKKQENVINLEDSPQEINDEVMEIDKSELQAQDIKSPVEIKEAAFETENMIDNQGQPIFADLGFNAPDDLRDLALDSNMRVISQTHKDLSKPFSEKDGNQSKEELQDLQLESPKERSDIESESSGVENI